jgi:hypothetical protein
MIRLKANFEADWIAQLRELMTQEWGVHHFHLGQAPDPKIPAL